MAQREVMLMARDWRPGHCPLTHHRAVTGDMDRGRVI